LHRRAGLTGKRNGGSGLPRKKLEHTRRKSGREIAPGAIKLDASGEFARFFAVSDAGGTFLLKAVFPVSGDVTQAAAFEVSVGGSAGATRSARITVQ